jgi:hypothetical protein
MKREQQGSKPEVSFGGPHVASGLEGDPIAARTRQGMAERGLYKTQVAGGPNPPIPRLDMAASEGGTMADQAVSQRMPPPGSVANYMQQGQSPFPPRVTPSAPQQAALLPADLLPDEATKDPDYIEGNGSRYASSQPRLAYKYGIIRNGKRIAAQELVNRPGGLKPETVEGLKAAFDFQNKRKEVDSTDHAVEAAAAASPAGAAARLGQTSSEKPMTEDDRRRMRDAQLAVDDFDFHTYREMMMKDIINNDDQRKMIEERLAPMDVTDYIMNGYVEQTVPINSKLNFVFQSTNGQVDLALKRLIVKELKDGFTHDDRYILDKYAMMSVACFIHKINGLTFPDYRDSEGNFNDEKFWEKFNRVTKLGLHVLASLGVNGFWFDIRVRKLMVADSLGNG